MRDRGVCVYWKMTSGFIRPDGGGPDVFVHFSALESDSPFRELAIGVRVTFERGRDLKGRICAVGVEVVEAAA